MAGANKNSKELLEYVVDGDKVIFGPAIVCPLKKLGVGSFILEMAGLLIAALFGSGAFTSNSQIITLGIFAGAAIYMFGYKYRRIFTTIRDQNAARLKN